MNDLVYDTTKLRVKTGEVSSMALSEQFRDFTFFLFAEKPDPQTGLPVKKPQGTGFLIDIMEGPITPCIYLVTARHLIEDDEIDGQIYARFNTMHGGYKDLAVPRELWTKPITNDVAVFPIENLWDINTAMIEYLPTDAFATKEYVVANVIGFGDEVFSVSLFAGHVGNQRIQPVARFGHISLVPDEKINIEISEHEKIDIDAYLIDSGSWSGESGSPVFVYYNMDRWLGVLNQRNRSDLVNPLEDPNIRYALLGMIQGRYEKDVEINKRGDRIALNQGLAVVVASDAIIEVLMDDKLTGRRKHLAQINESRNPIRSIRSSRSGKG